MSQTILIVDDAPDWREMLAGLIKDVFPELQVVTASSVDEAKTHLNGYPIALAILDIRLDESDEKNIEGLDLAEFIHGHYPETQALIITGYASLETVKRAMHPNKSGLRLAVDYVEKDKLTSELLPLVASILDK